MSSAVDSLLTRLKIPDLIPKFRAMKMNRIVNLRRLTEEELRDAVPDDVKRKLIIDAINSRGTHDKQQQPQPSQINPPRNTEEGGRGGMPFHRGGGGGARGGAGGHMMGGSSRGGGGHMMGGSGSSRGGAGGRGGGYNNNNNLNMSKNNNNNNNMDGGNNAGGFHNRPRPCNHFFNGECKYGDNCRYSHDRALYEKDAAEGRTRPPKESVGNSEDYSEVCEIPTNRIKYLLANKAERLRQIHIQNHTHNKTFDHVDPSVEKFELIVYGSDPQSVLQTKKMILACIGVTRENEQKNRLQYTINELSSNQRAAKLLAACNAKNEGTARELSEASLKNIISFFRFEKQQDIRHFYVNTGNERNKLEIIATIVAQLRGVQAVMFCDQKRVMEMSKTGGKITRYFNGVNPLFIHRSLPKEERMKLLQEFKEGEENDNGIRERLLVTNEDYAKLARKTVIPYVNLVINYTVPRTEEYYLLQSLVAGRSDTVGVSILCVSPYDQTMFHELQRNIAFEPLEDEGSFRDTAVQLVYDTVANPLTTEDADPPSDWREKLNKKKE